MVAIKYNWPLYLDKTLKKKRRYESFGEFCKSERKMFSDKNKIDETSGLSFIVICDNKIILFYEQISILKLVWLSFKFYGKASFGASF